MKVTNNLPSTLTLCSFDGYKRMDSIFGDKFTGKYNDFKIDLNMSFYSNGRDYDFNDIVNGLINGFSSTRNTMNLRLLISQLISCEFGVNFTYDEIQKAINDTYPEKLY